MTRIEALSERQNHRCCYCGHIVVLWKHQRMVPTPPNLATRDHVEARMYGGKNKNNIVMACLQCNNLRGSLDALAFANLTRKWFARDPALHARWHCVTRKELRSLQDECLRVQEAQLRGVGIRSIEHAFRHLNLVTEHGHRFVSPA